MISIKINWETPQHQKDSTWENGWSREDNLAASAAIQPNGEQAGKRRRLQTRLRPLGSLLYCKVISLVLDKAEQIKALHLRAISEKKKVSLQPTLTRRMIRDVGAHINAANYQDIFPTTNESTRAGNIKMYAIKTKQRHNTTGP